MNFVWFFDWICVFVGETPTEKITVGLGKPLCPSLYEGLNITTA